MNFYPDFAYPKWVNFSIRGLQIFSSGVSVFDENRHKLRPYFFLKAQIKLNLRVYLEIV